MLENFNEVFTNGWARIVAVAGGVQSQLACGRTHRRRFDLSNQLFRALDERISVNFRKRCFRCNIKRAFQCLSKRTVLVQHIGRNVYEWDR